MSLRFRSWWQPARKAGDPHEDRTVSFLELFYDLVYVVLVSELAHALAVNLDLTHIGQFVFLFSIVWWSWLNGTMYHDSHGNNDIRTRVFFFLQMFAVAGMAVFAHNALAEGSVGFALFYGLFQLILSYLHWRLAAHDPVHHQENRGIVIAFSVSTLLFFVSIFVPAPFRFYIWSFAVLLSLLQPLIMFVLMPPAERSNPLHFSPALVERFGLFTILVLAEIFVGVVSGLTYHEHVGATAFITGGLGLCLAFAMWWLYFDFVSHRIPLPSQVAGTIWLYMHLFVTMSIVVVGTAVLNSVEHAGDPLEVVVRWTLVGAIAVYLLSLLPLMRVITVADEVRAAYGRIGIVLFIAAVVIALLGFTSLAILPLLLVVVGIMLFSVLYALMLWVKMLDARVLRH